MGWGIGANEFATFLVTRRTAVLMPECTSNGRPRLVPFRQPRLGLLYGLCAVCMRLSSRSGPHRSNQPTSLLTCFSLLRAACSFSLLHLPRVGACWWCRVRDALHNARDLSWRAGWGSNVTIFPEKNPGVQCGVYRGSELATSSWRPTVASAMRLVHLHSGGTRFQKAFPSICDGQGSPEQCRQHRP